MISFIYSNRNIQERSITLKVMISISNCPKIIMFLVFLEVLAGHNLNFSNKLNLLKYFLVYIKHLFKIVMPRGDLLLLILLLSFEFYIVVTVRCKINQLPFISRIWVYIFKDSQQPIYIPHTFEFLHFDVLIRSQTLMRSRLSVFSLYVWQIRFAIS